MQDTTLCYIERDNQYLMLYRNKKKNDLNAGKWIGVGGKVEPGETPEECVIRETWEETGLTLKSVVLRGVIMFYSDVWEDEVMYLYSATDFGCEGRPDGYIQQDKVWLISATREEKVISVSESVLVERDLNEGDYIIIDAEENIIVSMHNEY